MKVRVQVAIPVMLFFVVIEGALIVLHYWADDHQRKTIEFTAAIVGAGTAIYSVLLGVHSRRTAVSGSFIERWNSPTFNQSKRAYVQAAGKVKADPAAHLEPNDRAAIITVLDFFEDLSLAVLMGRADEDTARGFFYSIVTVAYAELEDWVKRVRIRYNQPTAFQHSEELYNRWRPHAKHE